MKTLLKKSTLLISPVLLSTLLLLIACGNRVNNHDKKRSSTPDLDLQAAIIMNDYNTVVKHIEAGTDLNSVEPEGGSTPLITSIVFGRNEISKALIDAGANLSIKNLEGSDALFISAMFCRTETLKLLLDKGADPQTVNKYGSTPLQTAELPFEVLKPVYDEISKGLGPFGLKLDYSRLESERPLVAEILRSTIQDSTNEFIY